MNNGVPQWYLKLAGTLLLLFALLTATRTVFADPLDSPQTGDVTYNDTKGHWAERDIAEAAAAGYVSGYADGSFGPDRAAARADFMVMLARALRIPAIPTVEDELWFEPYIQSFSDLGIDVRSDTDESLVYWESGITRGEAARWCVELVHMAERAAVIREGDQADAREAAQAGGNEFRPTHANAGPQAQTGLEVDLSLLQEAARLGIMETDGAVSGLSAESLLSRAQAVIVINRLLKLPSLAKARSAIAQ
ncbi:S-layer homology domain-containing protein [Paenibacillus thalictri]|uniref:S-layer homology domain-containing protein n=1 Tax=Paenibacillus thalictri TaxID=2527873 RepID=A0A4V2J4N7_9BACL|nr:S-layer homology domain-containing protein [Paenibacillus thalictri]TBL80602.1 S-layer homology domain-containing protein [Paenibacillus thalictri]